MDLDEWFKNLTLPQAIVWCVVIIVVGVALLWHW